MLLFKLTVVETISNLPLFYQQVFTVYLVTTLSLPIACGQMVPAEERFSQLNSGPLFPGSGSGGGGQGFAPVLPAWEPGVGAGACGQWLMSLLLPDCRLTVEVWFSKSSQLRLFANSLHTPCVHHVYPSNKRTTKTIPSFSCLDTTVVSVLINAGHAFWLSLTDMSEPWHTSLQTQTIYHTLVRSTLIQSRPV